MALATNPITAAERARRVRVYEEALASVRLEGFELDEHTQALYQRYLDGELTLAQVGAAIDELDTREFVPVHQLNRDGVAGVYQVNPYLNFRQPCGVPEKEEA